MDHPDTKKPRMVIADTVENMVLSSAVVALNLTAARSVENSTGKDTGPRVVPRRMNNNVGDSLDRKIANAR